MLDYITAPIAMQVTYSFVWPLDSYIKRLPTNRNRRVVEGWETDPARLVAQCRCIQGSHRLHYAAMLPDCAYVRILIDALQRLLAQPV